jgi:heme-degrading monooxygenase HmoA
VTDPAFARLPDPPYWAVVFSSRRRGGTVPPDDGYGAAAQRMEELAATYDGFLGIESARDASGFGLTVSYWTSESAIRAWRDDAEHAHTRATGRADWYGHYELRVARVERAYGWDVSG